MPRVDYEKLERSVAELFEQWGVPSTNAELAARALCYGDLVGHPSHGVESLDRIYLAQLRSGRIDPAAAPEIIESANALARIDAHRAIGLFAGTYAMNEAMRRARVHGIALVGVTNSTHFGCAGYYSRLAALDGMVGVAMTNCGSQRLVTPPDARDPALGTNAISVAAPAATEPPFVLDMSTSVAATGRIRRAARQAETIPPGWLADSRGRPVTDPTALDHGARLLPLGAGPDTGGYKGFGLGLAVEILCGLLTGAAAAPSSAEAASEVGHCFIAIDQGALHPPEPLPDRADSLFRTILDLAPVGERPVVYAGYPEHLHEESNRADGVFLDDDLYARLVEAHQEKDVAPPPPLADGPRLL